MIASGIGNGGAQYLWPRAIHLAPTSAVVPFQYIQLVWAMLLGFAIWGDLPTLGLLLGSAVGICSGLFLFWPETRRMPVVEPDTGLADALYFTNSFRAPIAFTPSARPFISVLMPASTSA